MTNKASKRKKAATKAPKGKRKKRPAVAFKPRHKFLAMMDVAEASAIRAEELQREIDHANEIIAKLERELASARARIAELEGP